MLVPAFIERLSPREVPREKMALIPDWGDTGRFQPLKNSSYFRAGHDILPGQFLVLHTGNMGKSKT